tara:strand:+ start:785 stop:1111 length:327 start_codon:yes stop_codon:yes gene_type:complete
MFFGIVLTLMRTFATVPPYTHAKGGHPGFPVVRESSTDVTRKGTPTDIVTLSAKDWITLLGIIVPILILCIFGWIRHDRLLTEVVTHQRMLTDRLERVENNLDAGILQ